MIPTIGRIVHYRLLPSDVQRIMKRRWDFERHRRRDEYQDTGYVAHFGDAVHVGDEFPLVITRVHGEHLINGQVILDGSDTFWATRVSEGEGPGTWSWPARV